MSRAVVTGLPEVTLETKVTLKLVRLDRYQYQAEVSPAAKPRTARMTKVGFTALPSHAAFALPTLAKIEALVPRLSLAAEEGSGRHELFERRPR
jgi:hypothetical protein